MSKKFLIVESTGAYQEELGYGTGEFVNTSAGVADAGKPIVLDANGLIASSMINVGSIAHDSTSGVAASTAHTAFPLLTGTRNFTGIQSYATHPTFTGDTNLVDKKYVDDTLLGSEWYPKSALDYVTNNTLPPVTEVSGDVYVLSHDGGTPHANWDGAAAGDIVQFNGSVWVKTTPTTGTRIGVDDEANVAFYLFGGSSWTPKYEESTTASTGLVKVGNDIRIDSSAAGNGLGFSSGVLSVNVDNSSIEITTDSLNVKALGITNAMLAGLIADSKLSQDYVQVTEVDNATIEWSGTALRVKADGINDTHIDFGTGLNQVSAADIPIADVGGYTPATDVESSLQELYGMIAERGVNYTSAGVTKGDLVYISANNTVSTFATLSSGEFVIGLAASTVAASGTVKVLADDTVATSVISGATAGDIYFWDGSSLVTTMPTGGGAYVWQAGIAKNATDLHLDVKRIKKNAV